MSLPPRPVTVVASDCSVVCASCGAVWAIGLPSPTLAELLARQMNGNHQAVVPAVWRARRGMCHGAGTGSQWPTEPPTKGTPDNWEDLVVVAQGEPEPEPENRPLWAGAALALAGLLRLGATVPRALAGGLLVPVLVLAALAWILDWSGVSGSAVTGLVLNAVAVLLVALAVTGVAVFSWKVLTRQASVVRERDQERSE